MLRHNALNVNCLKMINVNCSYFVSIVCNFWTTKMKKKWMAKMLNEKKKIFKHNKNNYTSSCSSDVLKLLLGASNAAFYSHYSIKLAEG